MQNIYEKHAIKKILQFCDKFYKLTQINVTCHEIVFRHILE